MVAAKYSLANLIAIVDYNDVQLDGPVHEIMPMEPFVGKWRAFGWAVLKINGHNTRQVLEALDEADQIHGQPTVIVAHTTKGKGVSFMEDQVGFHGRSLKPDEMEQARQELAVPDYEVL